MDIIILVGRILFALVFLGGGIGHLTATAALTEVVRAKGIPAPRIVVLATGVLLVVAALMVVLGVWPDIAALALFCFLLPAAFLIHDFWNENDPDSRLMEQVHFNKDVSLAGGALTLLGFLLLFGDEAGLLLTDPLLSGVAG